ncbi:MAG: hypothetical protein C4576_09285 [Desulfobacteraceae bacterium]|nr:MAG: hypothetical protein C4576_09285 [Desulfobacteraceae bacterium]
MKIQDLVAGKGDGDQADVEGLRIAVPVLKRLMNEGYEHIRVYKESRTFSLWGKTCSACFTQEYLTTLGGSR